MDTNENNVITEVTEATEELITEDLKEGFDVKDGVVLVICLGVAVVTYKYIIKPMVAKIKAKKNKSVICEIVDDTDALNNEVEE